jgi:hypothetical protein
VVRFVVSIEEVREMSPVVLIVIGVTWLVILALGFLLLGALRALAELYVPLLGSTRVSRRKNAVELGLRAKFVGFFSVAIGSPASLRHRFDRWC